MAAFAGNAGGYRNARPTCRSFMTPRNSAIIPNCLLRHRQAAGTSCAGRHRVQCVRSLGGCVFELLCRGRESFLLFLGHAHSTTRSTTDKHVRESTCPWTRMCACVLDLFVVYCYMMKTLSSICECLVPKIYH